MRRSVFFVLSTLLLLGLTAQAQAALEPRLGGMAVYMATVLAGLVLMMGVYMLISLAFSLLLNWYNERIKLVER